MVAIKLEGLTAQVQNNHHAAMDTILGINDLTLKRITRLEKNAGLSPLE